MERITLHPWEMRYNVFNQRRCDCFELPRFKNNSNDQEHPQQIQVYIKFMVNFIKIYQKVEIVIVLAARNWCWTCWTTTAFTATSRWRLRAAISHCLLMILCIYQSILRMFFIKISKFNLFIGIKCDFMYDFGQEQMQCRVWVCEHDLTGGNMEVIQVISPSKLGGF